MEHYHKASVKLSSPSGSIDALNKLQLTLQYVCLYLCISYSPLADSLTLPQQVPVSL